MINFREIFNMNYSFIGIILIFIIIMIIMLLNKNIWYSTKLIGKSFIISGIIGLIINLIIYIGNKVIVMGNLKIFINIIISNVIKNLLIFSLISIIMGSLLIMLSSFLLKKTR